MAKTTKGGADMYCHNSTEHGWHDCPLRLSHESGNNNRERVHATEETTSHAWCTQVREVGNNDSEDSHNVIGNEAEGQMTPPEAQPEERAACW